MGDDVAAVPHGRGTLLLTTDALSEGTHFLPESPPRAIGRAAVGVSLSDIASKGGRPLAVLITLLVPPSTPRHWARELVRGAEEMARQHGCHVVGGDTKPSSGRSVVGAVIGVAPRGRLAARSLARPGDLLLTTGHVGRGGLAARPILEGRRPTSRERLALLDVRPRLAEGRALGRYARAMLDTSDGLAAAALALARASRVRTLVLEEALPLDPRLARIPASHRRLAIALYGGDYELLASVPKGSATKAIRAVRARGGRASVIGSVERGRGAFLVRGDCARPMPVGGWDPFRAAQRAARRVGPSH